jgi:Domain of unknown function (DUF4157)
MIIFAKPQTNAKSRRSGTVQRKRVFGETPGPTGECEQSRKKRGSEPLGRSGGHNFGRIAVGLQRKLAINQPGDRFEQEADRMAEYAVHGSSSTAASSISPITAAAVQREDALPTTLASNNYHPKLPPAAPGIVNEVLSSSGQPLDAATRDLIGSRFGYDFSRVRIHTDARAAESARSVSALAYTVGTHLVFGPGQYQPATAAGLRLLAHELAHTIQQGAAPRLTGGDFPFLSRHTIGRPRILQRYTVPADLACGDVVDWLNSNSPYAPEWAETRCTYSFNGGANVATSTLADGTVKASVKGHQKLSVAVNCPIDRPEWNPSRRANRDAEVAAWRAMRATLDAHESQHRKIGATWRATLESRWRAVDFSVTGADQADAMAKAQEELDSRKQQWGADAQAAQDAIDPFRGAVLTCP